VNENRGALLALGLYVAGNDIARLFPEARAWPRPDGRSFLLLGRDDLAKHFIVSAAAAASAGVPAADALGLYKEFNDAGGGSGFSFADLAADRAGTTFGQAATVSVAEAQRIQQRIQTGLVDADIMPAVGGLPENLSQADFVRRYRGPQQPAYDALLKEINDRIAALPMFGN
jgi:hypothetical protein